MQKQAEDGRNFTYGGMLRAVSTAALIFLPLVSSCLKTQVDKKKIAPRVFSLSVTAAEGGSILLPAMSPTDVTGGAPVSLSASAADGYLFSGWSLLSGTSVA